MAAWRRIGGGTSGRKRIYALSCAIGGTDGVNRAPHGAKSRSSHVEAQKTRRQAHAKHAINAQKRKTHRAVNLIYAGRPGGGQWCGGTIAD